MSAERIYRLLLRAYPPDFRAEYEREMVLLFRDQCRESDVRTIGFWAAVIWDVARSAPALRAEAWRTPRFCAQGRRAPRDIPDDRRPETDGSHVALAALVPKEQHHLSFVLGSKVRRVSTQQQAVDTFGTHAGLTP